MKSDKFISKDINEFIAVFPEDTQKILQELRKIIHRAVPEAEEVISYQMPAFKLNGILVYFSAYKNHIGFYPTSSGIAAFSGKLASYECSKGTVKFPLDKPLPVDLITEIVRYRVKENLEKAHIKERIKGKA